MSELVTWAGLALLGLGVGAYGTLIGAGGGFVLVPLLLILYPDDAPEQITSISLAVVAVNAFSGSIAYARQKRIDYLAANTFAAATVPGAIVGALVVGLIPRATFDVVFALVMLAAAVYLLREPSARVVQRVHRRGEVARLLTDSHGDTYAYSFDRRIGVAMSSFIGLFSSLLGIGGGIIQVPAMIRVLRFPAHIATATSQYVLTVTAVAGTLVHLFNGELASGYERIAAISLGVVLGAQIGALVSLHLRSESIVRLLSLALGIVGLRVLWGAVF